jgi:hypothetical protein
MQNINPLKAGLTLGGLTGAFHLFWAALVAIGLAQRVIDFVFWMHFIRPLYVISPFNISTAVILVTVTFTIGYAMGLILACLWNFLQK